MGALAYSVTTGGLVPECGFYEECDDRVRAPVKPASRFSRRWPVGSAGAHQGGREAGPGVRQRRPSIAGLSRQGIYAQLGRWPPGLPGGAGGRTSHAVTQRRAKPADSLQRGLLMNPPWTPDAAWCPVAATAPVAAAFCTIPLLHISGRGGAQVMLCLAFSVSSRGRALGVRWGGFASRGWRFPQHRKETTAEAAENRHRCIPAPGTTSSPPLCPDPAQRPAHSEPGALPMMRCFANKHSGEPHTSQIPDLLEALPRWR